MSNSQRKVGFGLLCPLAEGIPIPFDERGDAEEGAAGALSRVFQAVAGEEDLVGPFPERDLSQLPKGPFEDRMIVRGYGTLCNMPEGTPLWETDEKVI